MNKIFFIAIICVITFGTNSSCVSATSENGMNEGLNKKSVKPEVQNDNTSRSVDDVTALCSKLYELKRMPNKAEVAGDPIYDGLKEKGREAFLVLWKKSWMLL
ncbi:MAG: hypothetical protein H0W58_17820 [Acidobacteria bacterium]|jgi:hypothetical protein|nr:hypothetical protein [Acidobacteriota bacterium]